jgi:5'-nucleotidase (lipoprotein e(P4) family)
MNGIRVSKRAALRGLVVSLLLGSVFIAYNRCEDAHTSVRAGAPLTADVDYQTGAILWTQSAAEYRALAYQAFNLARLRLDQNLRERRAGHSLLRRPAVVVDVDETVLDNSRYQAELVLRGLAFDPETWRAWCERAEAGAVPGAVAFLNYAARRGVSVFYITNRSEAEKAGTIANLRKLGFPNPSEERVMVRENNASSSKDSRRSKVASRFQILLFAGDNLSDFNGDFTGKPTAERAAQVDREQAEFGLHFIVVPNPMYGDWENAIYENKSRLSDQEKRTYRRSALRGL